MPRVVFAVSHTAILPENLRMKKGSVYDNGLFLSG